jgi:hypothetical protein
VIATRRRCFHRMRSETERLSEGDSDGRRLATSSAFTTSRSVSAAAVSASWRSLTANAYSRNRPCRVTLNRASDGKTRWNRPVLRFE